MAVIIKMYMLIWKTSKVRNGNKVIELFFKLIESLDKRVELTRGNSRLGKRCNFCL